MIDRSKYLTYDELLKACARDMMVNAIVCDRIAMFTGSRCTAMAQWHVTDKGERILIPGGSPPLQKTEHEKFREEVQRLIESMRHPDWHKPIVLMSDESDMDWDDEYADEVDDEVTDPGVGPPVAPLFAVPTVSNDAIMKSDKCYLCSGKISLLRFQRSPSDSFIVCVWCMNEHLGWELGKDGKLTKLEPEF